MKKWKKIPKLLRIFLIVFFILVVSELILRFLVGLGDVALYREDKRYEYFYLPNQDVSRFGNRIVTNEFGMRSKKVNRKKKCMILEFGDSVLNGGAHVDQDALTTSVQENKLNEKFSDEVQILNISAQSWGPSNAFAFLKAHGDFGAKVIVLVFSSHDYHDNMHFRKVVGNHPAWPDEKPMLAITDAWLKFIWPPVKRFFTGENEYDYLKDFNDSKVNPGWNSFFEYTKENKIPLIVYLHASQKEIEKGFYNDNGKKIALLCKKNDVALISDLETMKTHPDAYNDDVHLNAEGHEIMTELLLPEVEKRTAEIFSANIR